MLRCLFLRGLRWPIKVLVDPFGVILGEGVGLARNGPPTTQHNIQNVHFLEGAGSNLSFGGEGGWVRCIKTFFQRVLAKRAFLPAEWRLSPSIKV